MLNRKTYIGIAIIIIVCLFLIGLVWWWYGQQIRTLDKKIAPERAMNNPVNRSCLQQQNT
jgi:uncharacterized membrane protein YqiK